MKTAKDWFLSELDEETAHKAIWNTIEQDEDKLLKERNSLSSAIDYSFKWAHTPEKHEFWLEIYMKHSIPIRS